MNRTQADIVRSQLAEQRLIVTNLLQWTDLKYGTFQEEIGIQYLKTEFSIAPDLVDQLTQYKAFWSWWRLHWMRRDVEFIEMSSVLFKHELEDYYRKLHDPSSILFKPHSAILKQTYLQMVHALLRDQVSPRKIREKHGIISQEVQV